jgi:hypothetical protein
VSKELDNSQNLERIKLEQKLSKMQLANLTPNQVKDSKSADSFGNTANMSTRGFNTTNSPGRKGQYTSKEASQQNI